MSIGTSWTGPLISGSKLNADGNGPANTGLALLTQQVTLTQNGTTAVSGTLVVPGGSTLHNFVVDTTTAWNSGTSDVLSIGVSPGDTTYASGVSVATAGRASPTYTAAQLEAMLNTGAVTNVVVTVTPSGTAATTGSTTVTMEYIQNSTTAYSY